MAIVVAYSGYNFADYWGHWLSFSARSTQLPKVFHVNWFRQDAAGKYMRPATLPGDRCEGPGRGYIAPSARDEPTAAVGQRVAALLPDTGRVRTTGEHHDGGGGSASSPEGSTVSATVSDSSTSTSTPWSATVFNPHGLGGIDSIFAVAVQESDGRWLRCWSASAHGLDHPPRHR